MISSSPGKDHPPFQEAVYFICPTNLYAAVNAFIMKKIKTTMTHNLVVPGDSREVMIDYYRGKILELEDYLDELTILQHPIQIQTICGKIIAIKNIIRDMKPSMRPMTAG